MDCVDEHLATSAESTAYSTAIRAALAIGKKTLNRYYNKTDQSEVYPIAMGKSQNSLNVPLIFTNLLIQCSSPSSSQTPVFQIGRLAG